LKCRAIAAILGSALFAVTLAASPPASAAIGNRPIGRASLAPLTQDLSQSSLEQSAVGGKPDVGGDASAYLTGVSALSASDAWAVGWYLPTSGKQTCAEPSAGSNGECTLVEHWNGKSWTRIPSPTPAGTQDAELKAVKVISATDAWAVGFYYCPPGSGGACTTRTLIEHWNGKNWKIVPSPNPTSSVGAPSYQLSGLTAVSPTNIWAVGTYTDKPGTSGYKDSAGLIEHWNGKTWKVVTSPNTGSQVGLRGVAAVSATDIWAVGDDNAESGDGGGTIVEHWNGHDWSSVHSPNPTPDYSNLFAVAVVSAKDIWAVGNDGTPYTAGGQETPGLRASTPWSSSGTGRSGGRSAARVRGVHTTFAG
jgi:hypothetical protein